MVFSSNKSSAWIGTIALRTPGAGPEENDFAKKNLAFFHCNNQSDHFNLISKNPDLGVPIWASVYLAIDWIEHLCYSV
jgi:hypothetical protein